MHKKNSLLALVLGAVLLAGAASAQANTIVYSENFNAAAFQGSPLNLGADSYSERWANTDYYTINNANGWAFQGATYLAKQTSSGNQAVLLNETTGVATHLTGLSANTQYVLTFNLSGDNRPNLDYRFKLDIDGVNVLNIVSQWSTTNPAGHQQTVAFTTGASPDALLRFYQGSGTSSSPIIDDVVVSTVPDGGMTSMLIGVGMLGLGLVRRMGK